ncbi:hypothetical protein PORY_000257 [Pneumocystis oryctolagi]|uniref:Uncharacterized protein n=1 Tax=Pneumocystis oryctolagi TaxID=42067 RepID=A0ACB7CGS5_9ASCO|nr:hypothetical protein PORY_000257 [Pneumocystis oryctolagi]
MNTHVFLEFGSNNPFRSISTTLTIDSSKKHNPFFDRVENRSKARSMSSGMPKPLLPHVSSCITSRNSRLVSNSKTGVKTGTFCHECSRNNPESNDPGMYRSTCRCYKYSQFKENEGSSKNTSKKKSSVDSRNMERMSRAHIDCIDLLDVTAVYGSGAFHHDGPFDACNPCRNKNSKKDPLFAFPKNSTSMSLRLDTESLEFPIDKYFGHRDVEAYNEFSPSAFYSRKKCSSDSSRDFSYETMKKAKLLRNSEMTGLGTPLVKVNHSNQIVMQHTTSLSDEEKDEKENKFFGFQSHSNVNNTNTNCKFSFVQRIRGAKKGSQFDSLPTQALNNESLPKISNQLEEKKGSLSTKKINNSVSQNNSLKISSNSSELSHSNKGFFSRVRGLKVGGNRSYCIKN